MTEVCRPFRPRFRFSHVTTRLRAWLPSNSSQNSLFCPKLLLQQVKTPAFGGRGTLPTSGASRLVWLPNRSKHTAHNHFETSLEEAAVSSNQATVLEYEMKYYEVLTDYCKTLVTLESLTGEVMTQ